MAEITRDGEKVLVRPDHDITASTVEGLQQELMGLIAGGAREVVLNLTDIEMIDSMGMGLLVAAHNSLSEVGGGLSLTNVSKDIFGLLNTMRLNKHFSISEA